MTSFYLNDFLVKADDEATYEFATRVAKGEASKPEIAEFLKTHAIPGRTEDADAR